MNLAVKIINKLVSIEFITLKVSKIVLIECKSFNLDLLTPD
jgi:hypothetical protein